jgi:hypothetical protein
VKAVTVTQAQIADVMQVILDDNALAAAKEHLMRLAAGYATRMSALAALDGAVLSFEPISRRVALFFAVVCHFPRISPGSELFRTVRTLAGVFQLVALLLVYEIHADAGQIRQPPGRSSRGASSRTRSRPMARAAVAHLREHARSPTFSSREGSLNGGCSQFDALLLARCAGLPFAHLAQRGDSTRDQRQ